MKFVCIDILRKTNKKKIMAQCGPIRGVKVQNPIRTNLVFTIFYRIIVEFLSFFLMGMTKILIRGLIFYCIWEFPLNIVAKKAQSRQWDIKYLFS